MRRIRMAGMLQRVLTGCKLVVGWLRGGGACFVGTTWAFVPASRQACLSGLNALAVMAMMGMVRPSGFLPRRISRVASRPFIAGICTSMRMASNCLGSTCANALSSVRPSG